MGMSEGRDSPPGWLDCVESMLDQYLERLGLSTERHEPTLAFLSELQAAHMISVPFENLDVCAHRRITTDLGHSLQKVVLERRGGWCFEVNGAFGWLLRELGFDVDYVSCRVFDDDGWGPPLDHCALVVRLKERRWFVDVGFGDNCMVPIPIEDGFHHGMPRNVEVSVSDDGFIIRDERADQSWRERLWCSNHARSLADFSQRSHHLQTEPGLSWSEKPFVTRALDATGSRITLLPGQLKRREGRGPFTTVDVSDADRLDLLLEHFNLVVGR